MEKYWNWIDRKWMKKKRAYDEEVYAINNDKFILHPKIPKPVNVSLEYILKYKNYRIKDNVDLK